MEIHIGTHNELGGERWVNKVLSIQCNYMDMDNLHQGVFPKNGYTRPSWILKLYFKGNFVTLNLVWLGLNF